MLNAIEARQLRRQAIQDSRELESLTFGEAGFSPSSKWPQPMPWSFVDRVIETKRFLLISHGYSKEPFYIPKHALSRSDKERLSVLLNDNLKASQTPLQLLSRAT